MIPPADYPTPTFDQARIEHQWTEFLRELVIDWRWAEQNPDGHPEEVLSSRESAWELLGYAVAQKDSGIFRTIATILDSLPEGKVRDIDHVGDLNPLRFVVEARLKLEWQLSNRRLAGLPTKRLTKREVRRLAQRSWATALLIAGGKLGSSLNRTPADKEKMIQQEIERLPKQDWTKLFKKAGCTDLAEAPAGRPPKKKRKS
jgi:hypothetical protein